VCAWQGNHDLGGGLRTVADRKETDSYTSEGCGPVGPGRVGSGPVCSTARARRRRTCSRQQPPPPPSPTDAYSSVPEHAREQQPPVQTATCARTKGGSLTNGPNTRESAPPGGGIARHTGSLRRIGARSDRVPHGRERGSVGMRGMERRTRRPRSCRDAKQQHQQQKPHQPRQQQQQQQQQQEQQRQHRQERKIPLCHSLTVSLFKIGSYQQRQKQQERESPLCRSVDSLSALQAWIVAVPVECMAEPGRRSLVL
jgi:hypothetical protein